MRKAIIARHGSYHDTYDEKILDQMGIRQMESIAERIGFIIESNAGWTVRVLASPSMRTSQGADIIAARLGVTAEIHEVFYSDDQHPPQLQEATELIQRRGEPVDVVVVVTHFEYGKLLPEYFGNKVLRVHTFPVETLRRGEAWLIDCEGKEINRIQP